MLLICTREEKARWQRKRGVFLGYDKESPAYLIYYPESGAIGKSRCVRFTDKLESEKNACDEPCQTEPQIVEGDKDVPDTAESPVDDPGGNRTIPSPENISCPDVTPSQVKVSPTPSDRYPSRQRKSHSI